MVVELDARCMGTREEAHEYLKNNLGFPEYYGRNLDALYDLLTEFCDIRLEIVHANEAGPYFQRVLAVMNDACKVEVIEE